MAACKTGAFLRSKFYTPFYKTSLKWIPRSKSGASKSRPHWAAHTHIGNVWEYSPPPAPGVQLYYVKKFNYHALFLLGGSLMLLVIPDYLVALL